MWGRVEWVLIIFGEPDLMLDRIAITTGTGTATCEA